MSQSSMRPAGRRAGKVSVRGRDRARGRGRAARLEVERCEDRTLLAVSYQAALTAVAPSTGGTLASVATSDFDKDGKLDLVTASPQGVVSTYLGDGLGGYTLAGSVSVGGNLTAVVAGNLESVLDISANPDLAVVDAGGKLTFLIGDGKGGFAVGNSLTLAGLSGAVSGVVAGDFVGDTNVDLAVVDGTANVTLFQGDGTTAPATDFVTRSTVAAAGSLKAITAGHLDGGDALTDLAVVDTAGAITIIKQSPAFTYAAGTAFPTTGSTPVGLADLTKPVPPGPPSLPFDNLALARADGTVTILTGNGNGGLVAGTPINAGASATAIASGHLIGLNSADDLVVTDPHDLTVLDSSTNPFAVKPAQLVDGPVAFASGNFHNNPLKTDLIFASADGTLRVGSNNGLGAFTTKAAPEGVVNGTPTAVIVGSFGGTVQNADVAVVRKFLVAGVANYGVTVFWGDGAGNLTLKYNVPVSTNPISQIVTGNFTADAVTDLAVLGTNGALTVLNGATNFTAVAPATATGATNPTGLIVGRFDADATDDLAVSYATNVVIVLQPAAGTLAVQAPAIAVGLAALAGITDGQFNADAFQDIVAVANGGQVYFLAGKGDGTFNPAVAGITLGSTPSKIRAAQADAGGALDLVASLPNAVAGPKLAIALGNGNGTFVAPAGASLLDVTYAPADFVTADFEGLTTANVDFVTLSVANPHTSVLFPTPVLTVTDVTGNEGDSPAATNSAFDLKFKISLSSVPLTTASFDYATANVTAIAGVDYVGVATKTVTFGAGSSATQFATVQVIGNYKTQANPRTFKLNLTNPVNVAFATPTPSATGTITDDDFVKVTTTDDVATGDPAKPATYVSLRKALLVAAANNNGVPVTFDLIQLGATPVIKLDATLGTLNITSPTTVDARGAGGAPTVGIDGSAVGAADGFTLNAGLAGTTIEGLAIYGFAGAGVNTASDGNVITLNYFGLKLDGTKAANGIGVTLGSGANTVTKNLFKDNTTGVLIAGTAASNLVQGNTFLSNAIGVNLAGTGVTANRIGGGAGLGNTFIGDVTKNVGVFFITGAAGNFVQGNTFSSLFAGVRADGSGANVVGIDPTGTLDAGLGNVIVKGGTGVLIGAGSKGLTVAGNTINQNVVGISAVDSSGIYVGGSNALLANTILVNTDTGILIAGSKATGNVVWGNWVSGNTVAGISIGSDATGNSLYNNKIGTDKAGLAALPNGNGVVIAGGAKNNVVGNPGSGDSAGFGNLISGNNFHGIAIVGAGTTGNRVAGNMIGTDATSAKALGNTLDGVLISGGASNNAVGGTTPFIGSWAGNLISGNGLSGVQILGAGTSGNTVVGNLIGTARLGDTSVFNLYGVSVTDGASNNVVGGGDGYSMNIISGNYLDGVALRDPGTTGNQVAGNRIGTDVSGTQPLRNLKGVSITGGASGNIIGAVDGKSLNLISGNYQQGVYIYGGNNNTVSGNLIGTDYLGTRELANYDDGVLIAGVRGAETAASTENTIGGLTALPGTLTGNVISGNIRSGVRIVGAGASGNMIQGNLIGVDFGGSLVVPNHYEGVSILNAPRNRVGGSTVEARNVISGNGDIVFKNKPTDPIERPTGDISGANVEIFGKPSVGNVVLSNIIGLNREGTKTVNNSWVGVLVQGDASGTIIGQAKSPTASAGNLRGEAPGNLISGNTEVGVLIYNMGLSAAESNKVAGNSIGLAIDGKSLPTDSSGHKRAYTQEDGVVIWNANNTVVASNAISGNGNAKAGNANLFGTGIYIFQATVTSDGAPKPATGNTVSNNLIGTQADGKVLPSDLSNVPNPGQAEKQAPSATGNLADAIYFYNAGNNNIGGSIPGRPDLLPNVIAGNGGNGIQFFGKATTGNVIGTNNITGNQSFGILFNLAKNTTATNPQGVIGSTANINKRIGGTVQNSNQQTGTIFGNGIGNIRSVTSQDQDITPVILNFEIPATTALLGGKSGDSDSVSTPGPSTKSLSAASVVPSGRQRAWNKFSRPAR